MAPKSGARSHLDYEAQLAKLVDQPPAGEAWLHEQKFDGYRIGLRKDGAAVSLWSRRDNDWTAEFRSVAAAGAHLAARDALIDGEVAVLLPSGLTSFQSLQNRRAGTPLVYMAFDLLALDGADLRPLPVEERKGRLAALIGASAGAAGVIRYSDHIVGQGPAFFEQARALGLEGVVSKRLGSPYRSGRGETWLKAKCTKREAFVVGGFTEPDGARDGIGSLLLGVYEDGRLRWTGKVGTGQGWTATYLRALRKRLDGLAAPASPFDPPVSDASIRRKAKWVRPELVAEVVFTEWTNDGHVRHPTMQGLREDKVAADVRSEVPSPPKRHL